MGGMGEKDKKGKEVIPQAFATEGERERSRAEEEEFFSSSDRGVLLALFGPGEFWVFSIWEGVLDRKREE